MNLISFSSPEEAENAFYTAFEKGDLEAMMHVWLDADYIECIHPMSHRLMGLTAIRDSWQEIFSSNGDIQFQTVDTRRITHRDLAVHIVVEHLQVNGSQQVQILATNIYEKSTSGWHMILHHASPAPRNETEESSQTVH